MNIAGLAEVNICWTCRSELFPSGGGGGKGDVNIMFCVYILPPAQTTDDKTFNNDLCVTVYIPVMPLTLLCTSMF